MVDKQKIDELICDLQFEKAIKALSDNVAVEPANADWLILRGQLHWRLGQRGRAMSDMEAAAAIDPNSAAAGYLDHYRSIMDFFSTDMFNP